MSVRSKKCKVCKMSFKPFYSSTQSVCSVKCSAKLAKEKEGKKAFKEMKEKSRTKKDYLKILTTVFNSYIRKRDEKLPCISCRATNVEEYHAGHYMPSTYSYLRFNELNVNKQCSKCNTHLRGNLLEYRKGLIKKIGVEFVEHLEEIKNNKTNLDILQLKELILTYRKKYKELCQK